MRLPLVIWRIRRWNGWHVGRGDPPRPAVRGSGGVWKRGMSLRLRSLQCVEHGLRVAGHLDLAPGLRDAALGVDEERAALDAHDLAPVHVLLVDHVEGSAQR